MINAITGFCEEQLQESNFINLKWHTLYLDCTKDKEKMLYICRKKEALITSQTVYYNEYEALEMHQNFFYSKVFLNFTVIIK